MHLALEGLVILRGGRLLLEGLSMRLSPGDALIVEGPNGAGKTSLLRTLAGLLPAGGGRVSWSLDGRSFATAGLGDHVHYVGHLDGLKRVQTARENLAFAASCLGARHADVLAALAALGLARVADIPAGFLSQGQRRRLALARLLLAPRPLWLLDEPAASLDEEARAVFASLADRHRRGGGILVAATHEALALAAPVRRLLLGRPRAGAA